MSESTSLPPTAPNGASPANDPRGETESNGDEERFPDLVVGRGQWTEYALERLRASILLKISMAVAFVCYGMLIFLVLSGRMKFPIAGVIVLMSLGSWFFLFWWYPVLERTRKVVGEDPNRQWIGSTLEAVATACVVLVHLLLAFIVVHQARGGS